MSRSAPAAQHARIWARRVAMVVAMVATPLTLLRVVGWDSVTPGPQLLAMTPLVGLVTVGAIAGAVVARAWTVATLLTTLALLHGAWTVPAHLAEATSPGGEAGRLTVLTVNAAVGAADAQSIVSAARSRHVDLLVVVELTPELTQHLVDEGVDEELPHSVTAARSGPAGTGLFSRHPLTELPPVPNTAFTQVRAAMTIGDLPDIPVTAVHTFPPLPGTVAQWRHDLTAVAGSLRTDGAHALAAGDFNASWDHTVFRSLLTTGRVRDAARQLGAGWFATWPSGTSFVQLDHVVSGDALDARDIERLRIPGTDHLAVLATLAVKSDAA